MYKAFYDLSLNPFGASPDPRFLYMMPQTKEALARLQYGISARKGFIVVSGEVGTGKTTLLRRALGTIDPGRIHSAFVFNPILDPLEFLEFVLNDFGLTPVSRTKASMLIQLNRWLVERFRNDEFCVIFVDEAQDASSELLEEIRLLTNLETGSEKLLQIVLSGQPELEQKLNQPSLRQLRQRVSLWCRTSPLDAAQIGEYIALRLKVAGTDSRIFTQDAVSAIYRASRGIPRVVNLICEHALILGYVEQTKEIPAALIHAVTQNLDLGGDPFIVSSSQAEMARQQHTEEHAASATHNVHKIEVEAGAAL
jgi:type II secretory pathway predicted ATPase ExeA